MGGAGYGTFFECQALNIPFVVNPATRLYDRQHTRVYRWLGISPTWPLVPATAPEKVVEAVQSLLMGHHPKPGPYENGTIQAARLIQELIF
ncbi:MAG: hypothetical protein SFW36_22470 [Leptolyngbyaceae cyanobacterium bins.59]|nr:hypothetical protein [Leptolyngbyaceae cyanobacterium bins.59]